MHIITCQFHWHGLLKQRSRHKYREELESRMSNQRTCISPSTATFHLPPLHQGSETAPYQPKGTYVKVYNALHTYSTSECRTWILCNKNLPDNIHVICVATVLYNINFQPEGLWQGDERTSNKVQMAEESCIIRKALYFINFVSSRKYMLHLIVCSQCTSSSGK